jgi:hypothetical protein
MGSWLLSVAIGAVGGLVVAAALIYVLDRRALKRYPWYVLPFPWWLIVRPWRWREFRRFFRQQ